MKIIFLMIVYTLLAGCAGASGLHDFSSDGCSLFPDGTVSHRAWWCECCFDHDIAYWRGGTKEERLEADERLRDCVDERTTDKELGEVMFLGVRGGGHPAFPTWYRWGYGWNYGRGYAPLTDGEWKQVHDKLDGYFTKHPTGYCGPKK